MSIEVLQEHCTSLGAKAWLKADPAAVAAARYLRGLCRQYEVSTEGTYQVLLQRLYWARDVRWKFGKNQTKTGEPRKAMLADEADLARVREALSGRLELNCGSSDAASQE